MVVLANTSVIASGLFGVPIIDIRWRQARIPRLCVTGTLGGRGQLSFTGHAALPLQFETAEMG